MSKRILFELTLTLLFAVAFASTGAAFVAQRQPQQQRQPLAGVWRDGDTSADDFASPLFARTASAASEEDVNTNANTRNTRRSFLDTTARRASAAMTTVGLICATAHPDAAYAKAGGAGGGGAKISPEEAYQRLLGAREELLSASKEYLIKRDTNGLKRLVTNPDSNVNRMDTSMQALLNSQALDAESKKAIGTIRTYGIGADVLIMYGGLRGEFLPPGGIREKDYDDDDDDDGDGDDDDALQPNWGEVQKYLFRTLDSLQEIIVICRANGFEKKKKKS